MSSATAASVAVLRDVSPSSANTGASFTASTVVLTLWLASVFALGVAPNPLSITSNVTMPAPLASAVVLYFNAANSAAVIVVLAKTAVVPSALYSVIKLGIPVIL